MKTMVLFFQKTFAQRQVARLLVAWAITGNVLGATLTVNSDADSGGGTLREAITLAADGDIITFALPLFSNIQLASELAIGKDLTIQGPGASILTVWGKYPDTRVFHITKGRVLISGLSMMGGYAFGGPGANGGGGGASGGTGEGAAGGGILNLGELTLTDCILDSHTAQGGTGGRGGEDFRLIDAGPGGVGGLALGGAICNSNRLTLFKCSFNGNVSLGGAGGIGGEDTHHWNGIGGVGGTGGAAGIGLGGAIFNSGFLAATNCTFYQNGVGAVQAGNGGIGLVRGGVGGQGGYGRGGAIMDVGTSSIVNCTISRNESSGGWGGIGGVPGGSRGSDGTSDTGGVDRRAGPPSQGFIRNTIAAQNSGRGSPDLDGSFTSGGFNFVSATAPLSGLQGLTEPTDIVPPPTVTYDARLGRFGYHGGRTRVLSLLADSPCLDRGQSGGLDTDQRGMPRPMDDPSLPNAAGGDGSDIGAYEACAGFPSEVVIHHAGTDEGALREAIACIAPGGTIRFGPEALGTIQLASGQLVIDKDLTIEGPGANRLRLSGTTDHRVLHILRGRVRISGLSFENGQARGASGRPGVIIPGVGTEPGNSGAGGGILNEGDLTLTDCMVLRCAAAGGSGATGLWASPTTGAYFGGAGGEGLGGGICNSNRLVLLNCSLGWNSATGGGGGSGGSDIHHCSACGGNGARGGSGSGGLGGGVFNAGVLAATNCTLFENVAQGGNGGAGGGGVAGLNRGGHGGDGESAAGGALFSSPECVLVSCTIVRNRCIGGVGAPGGAPQGDAGDAGHPVAGGVFTRNSSSSPPPYVRNCIVADNDVSLPLGRSSDFSGHILSGGFNLIGDRDNNYGFTSPSDQVGTTSARLNPKVAAPGHYYSSTLVMPPALDSLARDQGQRSGTLVDQRGGRRTVDDAGVLNAAGGDGSDIGACETDAFLRITQFRKAGSRYGVWFNTEAGGNYRLESTDALGSGNWRPVGFGIAGTGGELNRQDLGLSTTQRFYRVRSLSPRLTSVYRTDFEHGAGTEWSPATTDVTPAGARRFLGQFGAQTVQLTLNNLPPHRALILRFDLYVMFSWDGNWTSFGPDVWGLNADGLAPLFETTFSNINGDGGQFFQQAYPERYPGGDFPACTGASEVDTLGYGFGGDTVYAMRFTIPHTSSSAQLNFYARGLEGFGNENWGLDNLEVIAVSDP